MKSVKSDSTTNNITNPQVGENVHKIFMEIPEEGGERCKSISRYSLTSKELNAQIKDNIYTNNYLKNCKLIPFIKKLLESINAALRLNQRIRRQDIPGKKEVFDKALLDYCEISLLLFGELFPVNFILIKSANKGYVGRKLDELGGVLGRPRIEELGPKFYEYRQFKPIRETPGEEIMINEYYENLEKKCDTIWDYLYMVCPLKPENEILYKHIVNECMRTFFGPGIKMNNARSIKEKIINFESRFGLKYDLGKLNIIVGVFSWINKNSEEAIDFDSVLDFLGGKKRKKKSKRKSKTKKKKRNTKSKTNTKRKRKINTKTNTKRNTKRKWKTNLK